MLAHQGRGACEGREATGWLVPPVPTRLGDGPEAPPAKGCRSCWRMEVRGRITAALPAARRSHTPTGGYRRRGAAGAGGGGSWHTSRHTWTSGASVGAGKSLCCRTFGAVAQLGEHLLCKPPGELPKIT